MTTLADELAGYNEAQRAALLAVRCYFLPCRMRAGEVGGDRNPSLRREWELMQAEVCVRRLLEISGPIDLGDGTTISA